MQQDQQDFYRSINKFSPLQPSNYGIVEKNTTIRIAGHVESLTIYTRFFVRICVRNSMPIALMKCNTPLSHKRINNKQ